MSYVADALGKKSSLKQQAEALSYIEGQEGTGGARCRISLFELISTGHNFRWVQVHAK